MAFRQQPGGLSLNLTNSDSSDAESSESSSDETLTLTQPVCYIIMDLSKLLPRSKKKHHLIDYF